MLQIINSYANKLTKHVNNLIDITEIENKTMILHKEKFDLIKLTKEVITQFKSKNEFSLSKINIDLDAASDSDIKKLIINADKNRIRSVIENLIANAIETTDSKNIKIVIDDDEGKTSLSVGPETPPRYVILSVTDDGDGIDPTILPKIFSKFITNSQDGLGLGLYLAKNIIDIHGGKIWAENNENGKGATFHFIVPSPQYKNEI